MCSQCPLLHSAPLHSLAVSLCRFTRSPLSGSFPPALLRPDALPCTLWPRSVPVRSLHLPDCGSLLRFPSLHLATCFASPHPRSLAAPLTPFGPSSPWLTPIRSQCHPLRSTALPPALPALSVPLRSLPTLAASTVSLRPNALPCTRLAACFASPPPHSLAAPTDATSPRFTPARCFVPAPALPALSVPLRPLPTLAASTGVASLQRTPLHLPGSLLCFAPSPLPGSLH